jgi:hypothetical protein
MVPTGVHVGDGVTVGVTVGEAVGVGVHAGHGVASGLSYSNTRLLFWSATYRLPAPSTATPVGRHRLPALMPPRLQVPLVKLPACPNTRSATVSVVRGLSYCSTRLLPEPESLT